MLGIGGSTTVTLTGSEYTSVNSLSFFDFDTSMFEFSPTSVPTSFAGVQLAIPVSSGVSFGFLFIQTTMMDFTISFDLAAVGLGDVSLNLSNVLAGFQQQLFLPPILEESRVQGTQVAVPEPATLSLFVIVCLIMFRLNRKA